ncbi:acyl carrier protein familyprotein [Actinobacteria bacterium OV450]|uniref:acyl carrier protein n=1 Tax=Streptomyces sp. NPDC056387 TaxID=3345803 RepID=UPI0006CDDE6E|nr:acyl carrier protein familyprotein [Actinobacteria bacterium OV450]
MSTRENGPAAVGESMETVIEFLRKLNSSVDTIDWDRDLIEARILDSLAFVEFLLLMEELTGEPIDLAKTDVDNFRTLNRINALITEGAGHAHA